MLGLLLGPRAIGAGGEFGAQYQVCQAAVEFIGPRVGVTVSQACEEEGVARLSHLVGKLQSTPRGHLAQQLNLYSLYIGVRVAQEGGQRQASSISQPGEPFIRARPRFGDIRRR